MKAVPAQTKMVAPKAAPILVEWGVIPYQDAVVRQLELVEAVARGHEPDTLVVCTHPPVVTLGRGTREGDVFGWQGEVAETSRGGRATYHGPNQIVVYPILNLAKRDRDVHKYLRGLEEAIVDTLREFGINGEARTIKREGEPSLTGVWVGGSGAVSGSGDVGIGGKKIASIGIAVKKWVTYHGLALNVSHDPRAFSGINPCGFHSEIMTSMEEVLMRPFLQAQVAGVLVEMLSQKLSYGAETVLNEEVL